MKSSNINKANRWPCKREGIISGLSITVRIAAWYTLLFLVAMLILTNTVLHFYNLRIRAEADHKLSRVVDAFGDRISDDGEAFIQDKDIRYRIKDIYISVYDAEGEFITGRRPSGIDGFPPLDPENKQMTEDEEGEKWYICDNIIDINGSRIYIRGMMSGNSKEGRRSFEIKMIALLIPTLLILAALGGYLVTRRVFDPIRDIIKTTEDITRDGDLSLRIPMGKSHDEIYELSESFNNMFDRIEEVVKREKQFTADVSHELRTPLAVIQAQSEYAMEDKSYAEDAVKVINGESRRMSALIGNLLMIARSDAGRMTPDLSDTDISTLLEEIVEVITVEAEEAGQTIETDISEDMTACTDVDMLTRVIINLLDNAIKYGRGDGGTIKLSAYEEQQDLICRISDDGDGVRKEDRDRIWERFYQADEARTEGGSTGIGLAIVAALTKALGGSIELLDADKSELGGASFELRIPRNTDNTAGTR